MPKDEQTRARELLMRLDALLGKPIVHGHIAEAAFQLILEALRGASGGGAVDELASYEKFDGVGPHSETIETRARIGERYLEAYESALSDPRLKGYTPADCPSELLLDLLNTWEPAHPAENAKSSGEVDGWQPIETAPKDGTPVDLWGEELGRMTDCYWGLPSHVCGEMGSHCDSDWHLNQRESWVDGTFNERLSDTFLTHWRSPPAPPAALARSGKGEG